MANSRKTDDGEITPRKFPDERFAGANDEYPGAMKSIDRRLEKLEDMKGTLEKLEPKIDDIFGFMTHKSQHLATKEEMQSEFRKVDNEIAKRPTTAAMSGVLIILLAVCTLPFLPNWWTAVKSDFSRFTNPPVSPPAAPKQQ